MNTAEFLLITSSIVPDRPAITFEGKKLSYADLSERTNRLANALAGLGKGAARAQQVGHGPLAMRPGVGHAVGIFGMRDHSRLGLAGRF